MKGTMRGNLYIERKFTETVPPRRLWWRGRVPVQLQDTSERDYGEITFVRNTPALEEAARGYFFLNQHLFSLQEKLTPIKEEWQGKMDARRLALNALATPCIGGALMIFNMLSQLGRDPSLKEFAKLADIKQEQHLKESAYNHLTIFTIAGACVLFQFQIENLFQNLWRALGNANDMQYRSLANNLLTHLDLKNDDRDNKLKFLAYMRNSLHNNGIHNGDDWKYQADLNIQTDLGPIRLNGIQEFERHKIVEVSPMNALAACCSALRWLSMCSRRNRF